MKGHADKIIAFLFLNGNVLPRKGTLVCYLPGNMFLNFNHCSFNTEKMLYPCKVICYNFGNKTIDILLFFS